MDSESSSKSSSDTNQTDNRRVIGERGISAELGDGNFFQVTTLDAEVANNAVNKSSENLKTGLTFGAEVLQKAMGFGVDTQKTALDSLNTQANLVKDAYADAKGRGALTDKILIGAIAMAGIVAFTAVKGK